jgi:hypothetical protein
VIVMTLTLSALPLASTGRQSQPVTDPETGFISYTEYEGMVARHGEGEVLYAQIPPVGGPHNGVWQDCGFYSEPIYNWHGVHSLEHGAVWITYDPALPPDQVARLQPLVDMGHVLITPYPGLTDPVVASSWARQVRLTGVDDPRLLDFVIEFRQNPETAPEPGAVCSLGTSDTVAPGTVLQTEPSIVSGTPDDVAAAEGSAQTDPAPTDVDLRNEYNDRD